MEMAPVVMIANRKRVFPIQASLVCQESAKGLDLYAQFSDGGKVILPGVTVPEHSRQLIGYIVEVFQDLL